MRTNLNMKRRRGGEKKKSKKKIQNIKERYKEKGNKTNKQEIIILFKPIEI